MTRFESSWPLTRSAYDETRWIANVPPWNVWLADWSDVETNSRDSDVYSGVIRRVSREAAATTISSDATMTRQRRRMTLR